ncbi:MAG: phosphoenolpyruvate synthase [Candidatus Aenigmarchaeota archaeon]|nr:phosphoenolpyruvate synthase [Candidatus Aenigmarchaeota archaeon]
MTKMIIWFKEITKNDVAKVGGKTANLGELYGKVKMPVPDGFAITADAYKYFIQYNRLDLLIKNKIKNSNIHNIKNLRKVGKKIRTAIKNGKMPEDLKEKILKNFEHLEKKYGKTTVAVRSSATAEDLKGASFAGQQETYLNVSKNNLIKRIKDCFASLFTDRAISYRKDKGFDNLKVYLSVAIQRQINSKASGVMFTLDPDTGWSDVIVINGSWGLGDYIVQGVVTPDEFRVFKPTLGLIEKKIAEKKIMEVRTKSGVAKACVPKNKQNVSVLTDKEIKQLAQYAIKIEKHYKTPMDIEWAKDSKQLYILQARPETVQSLKKKNILEVYSLEKKSLQKSKVLVKGQAIGRKVGTGKANIIRNVSSIKHFKKGQVLVTEMTDPDWEPIMKIASAIVTEKGGRTSHAAIVSRELGIPAVIGAENAMKLVKQFQPITVDCTSDPGKVWSGILKYKVEKKRIEKIPRTKTKILVNIGIPEEALEASRLPVDGVGLARQEFIINSYIREHPLYMIEQGRGQEFIDKLAEGIAKLAAPFYPRPVVVRLSDFKSNEYANLRGGRKYEPVENNPMIGWRGASRYVDNIFEPAFRLECKALRKCIDEMGLTNIIVMVPFCRTIEEAKKTIKIMKSEGLKGKKYVMAEIPSNIILADKFSKYFDGFSIGSNDLTQLTLGIDRDSEKLAKTADERNPAVMRLIEQLIKTAHKYKRKVGICGQAPSDFPDFVKFLIKNKIDSISINPDVAVKTKLMVAKMEKR